MRACIPKKNVGWEYCAFNIAKGTHCVGGGIKNPPFTPVPMLNANWFLYPLKNGFVSACVRQIGIMNNKEYKIFFIMFDFWCCCVDFSIKNNDFL